MRFHPESNEQSKPAQTIKQTTGTCQAPGCKCINKKNTPLEILKNTQHSVLGSGQQHGYFKKTRKEVTVWMWGCSIDEMGAGGISAESQAES